MPEDKPVKKPAKPSKKKPAFGTESKTPAPAVEEKPKEAKPKHFEMKKWKDLDMYQCLHCSWSTLNAEEMVAHIAEHLRDKEPIIRRTDTGFIDMRGDKIFREEVVGLKEDDKEV